jgi:acyl phosphate:glycerol-3-phosphate acyltransferase
LKGFAPVLAASYFGGDVAAQLAAGAGAIAGHLFPVWLGFKGGKGVATSIGVLLGLHWMLGVQFLVVWIALIVLLRISSLSALIAAASIPIGAWLMGHAPFVLPTAVMATAIWIMHRQNISRLIAGTEPKVSFGKKT